jgi:hypothetical protein
MMSDNLAVRIFHHLPKAGGTSFREALSHWFRLVSDYITVEETAGKVEMRPPIDLHKLTADDCLCGHFEIKENYLFTRYPDILQNPSRYQLFTILRDPLELKISMYYFAKKTQLFGAINNPLCEFILIQPNYISARFRCSSDNYKEILDRYTFVGLQKHLQHSINMLSMLFGKQAVELNTLNDSPRDSEFDILSHDDIEKFREINSLDYLIYEYGKNKFYQLAAELNYVV